MPEQYLSEEDVMEIVNELSFKACNMVHEYASSLTYLDKKRATEKFAFKVQSEVAHRGAELMNEAEKIERSQSNQ